MMQTPQSPTPLPNYTIPVWPTTLIHGVKALIVSSEKEEKTVDSINLKVWKNLETKIMSVKVILYSYLILKKMNERIIDS